MKCNYLLLLCLLTKLANAQPPTAHPLARLDQIPVLDGHLDDSCWQALPPLAAFTTSTPVFGQQPRCPTVVRLFYTETALYLAAHCLDPDGVRDETGIRDAAPTGDWFRISLDTWHDGQLAFDFTVTAGGVPLDSRQEAAHWDATWQFAVQQQASGWTLELRIPFTALRFPRLHEQRWGAQFSRYDRSSGEWSTWSPQQPLVQDRVLQFGTLTGIRDIRQHRRRSLAVHSETDFENNDFGNQSLKFGQKLGIDGRIGLNESATLDLTLLPPQHLEFREALFLPGLPITRIFPEGLPEPRQFLEEERDLFDRNTGIDYNPYVDGASLSWRGSPSTPERLLSGDQDGAVWQQTKLSARTRGNWRFGVLNALLGPAQLEYFVPATGAIEQETVQAVSDYLFTGAEYLLPNNSLVHLSNGVLMSGPGAISSSTQLSFRLRDRSNQYELAGGGLLPYSKRHTDAFLSANWNLRLARVNRRWGWQLSHFETGRSLVRPEFAPASQRYSLSRAGVSFREFRPRGPFLNLSANAGLELTRSPQNYERHLLETNALFSGLDRHFRTYTLQLFATPQERVVTYGKNGIRINRRVSPELGGGLSFLSDQRRRLQWSSTALFFSNVQGEYAWLNLNVRPSWVLGRRWRLSLPALASLNFKTLTVVDNNATEWLFERNNQLFGNLSLEADWFPARRVQLSLGSGMTLVDKFRREAVELQDNGALQPVNWDLGADERNLSYNFRLNTLYFFTPLSQLRFQLAYVPGRQLVIAPLGPVRFNAYTRAQLSLIWFLEGSKTAQAPSPG